VRSRCHLPLCKNSSQPKHGSRAPGCLTVTPTTSAPEKLRIVVSEDEWCSLFEHVKQLVGVSNVVTLEGIGVHIQILSDFLEELSKQPQASAELVVCSSAATRMIDAKQLRYRILEGTSEN
jgi:hypothetical protein